MTDVVHFVHDHHPDLFASITPCKFLIEVLLKDNIMKSMGGLRGG